MTHPPAAVALHACERWHGSRRQLAHTCAAVALALVLTACSGTNGRRTDAPLDGRSGRHADAGHRRSDGQTVMARQPRRAAVGIDDPHLRSQRLAAVRACAAQYDLAAHEGDAVGRYRLQGRLSDAALQALFAAKAQRAATLRAAGQCVVEAGFTPPAAAAALLPVLDAVTSELPALMRSDAKRWSMPLTVVREGRAVETIRRLAAAAGDALVGEDLSAALHGLTLGDIALLPPSPVPLVDGAGRFVGSHTHAVLTFKAATGLFSGSCLQRFCTLVAPRRGVASLRIVPQWRQVRCER